MLIHYKNIHFIGVGGAGMTPLAIHCQRVGCEVSGSDLLENSFPQLKKMGIKVEQGHKHSLDGIDLVVYSAAIKEDNSELKMARAKNIKCLKRSEMLGLVANSVDNIVVSGSHGKSTTSVMLSEIFNRSKKFNSSALIGAESLRKNSNYFVGSVESFIVEGDEYDRSFHELTPENLIILNIDNDHLDIYGSLLGVMEGFKILCSKVKDSGLILYNGDDLNCVKVVSSFEGKSFSFGIQESNDFVITNYDFCQGFTNATIKCCSLEEYNVSFKSLGLHNLYNMAASIAMAHLKGIPKAEIEIYANEYLGVKRRQEILLSTKYLLIDDYAHHSTELKAILGSLRNSYPTRRILALFQPHLYSRTKDQASEFALSFTDVDKLFISHIYPARESYIDGVSSKLIKDNMPITEQDKTSVFTSFDDLYIALKNEIKDNDIVISLGAGEINKLIYRLKDEITVKC